MLMVYDAASSAWLLLVAASRLLDAGKITTDWSWRRRQRPRTQTCATSAGNWFCYCPVFTVQLGCLNCHTLHRLLTLHFYTRFIQSIFSLQMFGGVFFFAFFYTIFTLFYTEQKRKRNPIETKCVHPQRAER